MFRAPMRSRDPGVADGAAVDRALTFGICGMGGRLEPPPESLTEALVGMDAAYGERAASRLERFAEAAEGFFVWTRDAQGFLWLGRAGGGWRYDAAAEAIAVDLVHVRSCDWLADPVPDDRAPAPVLATFARGGRNWQRIRARDALPLSARIWRDRRGTAINA